MKKVGLVCEGGGTKGAYTAGVLSCFIDQNIEFPYCVGISSGTVNLMGYISKDKHLLKVASTEITTDKKVIGLSPMLKEGQIYGLERIFNLLNEYCPFNYEVAMKNPVECETGLYNIKTGEIEYFPKDYLNKELPKASCALLLLSKPISIFNGLYMDAGLTTMIPIERSIAVGNNKHIFISTKEEGFKRKPAPKWQTLLASIFYSKYKHIKEDLAKRHLRYESQWQLVKELAEDKKALILRPSKNMNIKRSTQDKEKLIEWFELGYQDTLKRIEEIKQFLNSD